MLPIKNLSGETHQLTNVKQVRRRRAVNGEKKLEFLVVPGETNEHAWDSVEAESKIDFKGEPYIIKKFEEASKGERSTKKVDAVHTFFNTMINCFQYDVHSGSQTFFAALTRVFEHTPYNFAIIDTFNAKRFENFGEDNCLSLFIKVLEGYGAEFRLNGNTVYLEEEVGEQTNFQYRWKHNVKALNKSVSTQGLSNVIKGFGGKADDNGVYPIEYTLRSPNEALFPDMDYHMKPYYNENITTLPGMITALTKKLMDEPQLSITVDVAETGLHVVNEGDRGFIIYEPMDITISARVVEIYDTFEYLEGDWKLIKTEVTLSNIKDKLSDITTRFAQSAKQVERLFEGKESLPYNVLPEAIRIATEAINNSMTEIQYPPNQGIVLQDPNNPNNLVRLTSAGIALSTDGGVTYRTAMTAAGTVTNELVAGIIRVNNIQIVGEDDLFYWNGEGLFAYDPTDLQRYVRLNSQGLYIAHGAISIERPDGFVIMDNGISTFEVNIQGGSPPYMSGSVEVENRYYKTNTTVSSDCDFFSYEHKARFLKIVINYKTEAFGGRVTASIEKGSIADGNVEVLASVTTTEYQKELGATLTVDLGVPTGLPGSFYLRLKTNDPTYAAYARIARKWLEG